jgi:hypothetical protein
MYALWLCIEYWKHVTAAKGSMSAQPTRSTGLRLPLTAPVERSHLSSLLRHVGSRPTPGHERSASPHPAYPARKSGHWATLPCVLHDSQLAVVSLHARRPDHYLHLAATPAPRSNNFYAAVWGVRPYKGSFVSAYLPHLLEGRKGYGRRGIKKWGWVTPFMHTWTSRDIHEGREWRASFTRT